MAELLHDSSLVAAIEKLIDDADDFLWLVSPYISLHQRIRDKLKSLTRYKPGVDVIVVFGKNEDDANKSMSKDDVAFLKELPNIEICYERRLHAKFYASEDAVIVTSMNLHEFSQNNNIEIGLRFKSRKWLGTGTEIDKQLLDYFENIIDNSQQIYLKTAQGKASFMGLTQRYDGSQVEFDETDSFFRNKDFTGKSHKFFKKQPERKAQEATAPSSTPQTGYCIRTGKPIPFNPEKPLCAEAYKSWAIYKNPDFKEKFCHKTGQPSNGKTTMRNPIL